MAIHSLRNHVRPDKLTNQVRTSQSFARRLYLGMLLLGAIWIVAQFVGPTALLDADGLVVEEREVVTSSYPAQVISVAVRPGDFVKAGQPIATVVSQQMLTLISDLSDRLADARSRGIQVSARIDAIRQMLPSANQRVQESGDAARLIDKAKAGGFSTVTRQAQGAQEQFAAIREMNSLRAELEALKGQQPTIEENVARLNQALEKAIDNYRDGAVVARVNGTVGAKVAAAGAVVGPGEVVAELHYGQRDVLAYLPTNRFYSLSKDQEVIVTDGVNRKPGRVVRIEAITDQMPPEFQSHFGGVDRQQIIRVAVPDSQVFPLLTKVKVMNTFAPSNLLRGFGVFALQILSQGFEQATAAIGPKGMRSDVLSAPDARSGSGEASQTQRAIESASGRRHEGTPR